MKTLKQKTDAIKLLTIIKHRIVNKQPAIKGLHTAATLINLSNDHNRHMGQVCKLIDYASFVLGYPYLTLTTVEPMNGDIEKIAFAGIWSNYQNEIVATAKHHDWSVEQLDKIAKEIEQLPDQSARKLWDAIADRGHDVINYLLHRKIKLTTT